MENKKVAVLFLMFKRMEAVEAFRPIKEYKPDKLYIAADGPRDTIQGEKEECERARKAVLDMIDWPCEVKTLFRDKNLGCTDAVYGGISWFFENEEYGIINEDDVVISPDFFRMCEGLLPLYRDENRIMLISSRNHSGRYLESDEYVFAYFANIWGWASWRRAWIRNDNTFDGWEGYSKWKLIKRFGLFQGLMTIRYYNLCSNPNKKLNSWDYTWSYVINRLDAVVICPKVNLSTNVGIGVSGSTNYSVNDEDPYRQLAVGKIKWPLSLKSSISIDKQQILDDRKDFFRLRMIGLRKKMKKYLGLKME